MLVADRRRRLLYSRSFIVNALRFLAILVVFLREAGSFFWSVSRCSWPDVALAGKPAHILLVADVQYRFQTSTYSLQSFLYTSYLRRSWNVASLLRPHAVMFLGDMLQDAKKSQLSDTEYQAYVNQFHKTFALRVSPPPAIFYLPGNNDVGLSLPPPQAKRARRRYVKNFGPVNQKLTIQNHTLVLLDAPGLVEEDYARAAKGVSFEDWPHTSGAVAHVKSLANIKEPIILLTHIPLHRPDSASCGPLREKGSIRRGVGHGYQNTFGKLTSQYLLDALQPKIIFSADNRDFCEFVHSSEDGEHQYKELTIKSFSPVRHIQRPGFHMLSISPEGANTIGERMCTLPKFENGGWGFWLPLSLILLILATRNIHDNDLPSSRPSLKHHRSSLRNSTEQDMPYGDDLDDGHEQLRPDRDIWTPATAVFDRSPTLPSSRLPSIVRKPGSRHHKPSNSIALSAADSPTLLQTMGGTPRAPSPVNGDVGPGMRGGGDDEDDVMYPSQYAARRPTPHPHLNGNAHGHGHAPFFLRAPPKHKGPMSRRTSPWTWTFVFRGTRRRFSLMIPSVSFLFSLLNPIQLVRFFVHGSSRRVFLLRTTMDLFAVLWPASILWIFIVGWF